MVDLNEDECLIIKFLNLLIYKFIIYVFNVLEDDLVNGNDWVEKVCNIVVVENV